MSGVRAPELNTNLGWLNTDRPLLFGGELRGQVVVLDFWTYCCINCIHILPDLAFLEHKYERDAVTFIGVHSAKFSNEASPETIRSAILRYEIKHPVVIDENMKLWRAFAVRSWPTLIVVDPTGRIVSVAAGEGNREVIDRAIAQTLANARAEGVLANGPLNVQREKLVPAASGLKFPGKVFADAASQRLFIADSNHNRVVIAEWPDARGAARVVKVIGGGAIGRTDGPAEQATFNHPQGMCAGQGHLYVADTENHLIRAIDLESFAVRTVVGTGDMDNDRSGGGMGTQQGLNSPWDLTIEGATLYVAMAGTHQIWRVDLPVGFARALAGSGRENIVDGPTETAAFAQPSGICTLGGTIYVADSEVSAIRGIDMASERVFTVVGEGLFSFGDVDGTHPKAKLQHPLGVAAWDRVLLVADTYNHKIKVVDPCARSVRTLYGGAQPIGGPQTAGRPAAGANPLKPDQLPISYSVEIPPPPLPRGDSGGSRNYTNSISPLSEPGGLCVCGDELFIADTNNHRVLRVNLLTHEWHEVELQGLGAPLESASQAGASSGSAVIQCPPTRIARDKDIELLLDLKLPPGAYWNPESPWLVKVRANGTTLVERTGKSPRAPLAIAVPAAATTSKSSWDIQASLAYCTDGKGGICIPVELAWRVPMEPTGDSTRVVLTASVSAN